MLWEIKLFRILLLIVLSLGTLTSCVQIQTIEEVLEDMYNVVTLGSSEFDETKYVRVTRIFCHSVLFELYQDTYKAKNGMVLVSAGTNSTVNIGDGDSLALKLDGEIHRFNSNDVTTDFSSYYYANGRSVPTSMKHYVIPENVVRTAANSQEFLVRLSLLNDTYIEGKCSPLTFEEAQEYNDKHGLKTKQDHLDMANKVAGVIGFQKFVGLVDSTEW